MQLGKVSFLPTETQLLPIVSSYSQYEASFGRFPKCNKRNNLALSCRKVFGKYSEISWFAFPTFGLNTEIYSVNLHILSECWKKRTRKTSNSDTFYAVQIIFKKSHFLLIFPHFLQKELFPSFPSSNAPLCYPSIRQKTN